MHKKHLLLVLLSRTSGLINLREFWLILFLESYHLICVADNVPVRGENSKGVFDILRGGEGGTVYSVHSVHSIQ